MAITRTQSPRIKRDITAPSLTEGTGRAPLWRPFPAACGLFTASGNGSGRPWNTAAVVFLTARICL
ncbi:hypothetical protein AWP86_06395 [Escherichia coli]|nr:hypothetical protein AWP86_06395 [Escherichia coli]